MVAWYAASRLEGAGAEKDRSGRVTCCCKGGVAEAAAAPGGAAVRRLSATCVHVSGWHQCSKGFTSVLMQKVQSALMVGSALIVSALM